MLLVYKQTLCCFLPRTSSLAAYCRSSLRGAYSTSSELVKGPAAITIDSGAWAGSPVAGVRGDGEIAKSQNQNREIRTVELRNRKIARSRNCELESETCHVSSNRKSRFGIGNRDRNRKSRIGNRKSNRKHATSD